MDELKLYPAWRQAVQECVGAFDFGDLISKEWLQDALELPRPAYGTPEEMDAWSWSFLESVESFKDELLTEHKMALQNVRGKGYLIVMPAQQTAMALQDANRGMSKVMRKAEKVLSHVRFDQLNDSQIRENTDARSKIAALRMFANKTALTNGCSK